MGLDFQRILPDTPIIDQAAQLAETHLSHLTKHHGAWGWVMSRFSDAVKVENEVTNEEYYLRVRDIVDEMLGQVPTSLSAQSRTLLGQRILEIADSDTRKPVSEAKLTRLFADYFADMEKKPDQFETEKSVVNEVENLKQKLLDIPQLEYTEDLGELVDELKPGDFLVRKYHEENDNLICDLQHFFHAEGYREAYKCSHIAIYLGEIGGSHWIAEASMPHDGEPEIRRVKIDDPRFNSKLKNQYIIIRNKDQETAKEAARLATNYAIKLLPAEEKEISEDDAVAAFNYNYFEAARSLWHSPSLAFFGRHRLIKYYTDYKNGIPFEYFGEKRTFFCSHFALIMESMAEMNKSDKFQDFWKAHPAPVYHKDGGKIADLWYSIKKGIWSRWLSFWYAKEINASVSTQLDALRTSPQAAVNYMFGHKDAFEVVGMINHKGDFD